MKKLTLLLLLICNYAYAQVTYYFSESVGDDSRTPAQAQSQLTPWKTLAKASSYSASIAVGDNLAFKCGDVFYGSFVMNRSGSSAAPITLKSYGTGAKPVFTGLVTLSGWTLLTGNIYQASVAAKPSLNMVTVNGLPVAMGRTPNVNSGIANLGYYPYTSWSTNTAITAGGLFGTNWIGAQVIIRKNRYVMEKEIITAQTDSTITYRPTRAINPRQNGNPIGVSSTPVEASGLFITNDIRTLDINTEWVFDSVTNKLKMVFTGAAPSSYVVKVATVDTIINLNNKNNIIIDGIRIEGGNMANVFFQDASGITIKNCELFYCGAKSIFGWNTYNTYIQNNLINYSMSTGVDLVNRHARPVTVRDNTVKNTGYYQGMGCNYDDNDYKGIYASVDSFGVISNNNVDTVGYVGIGYNGNKVNVDSNRVNYFGFYKDDGGGIYTFTGTGIPLNYGRTVRNNIVLNGIGARSPQSNYTHIEGIYTDGAAGGIDIQRNSIGYVKGRSIHMNDPKAFNVTDNNAFSVYGWAINKHFNDSINNFKMTRNQFFDTAAHNSDSKTSYFNEGFNSTKPPIASTIGGSINAIGLIDSNYYNLPGGSATYFSYYYRTVNPGPLIFVKPGASFTDWKALGGKDLNSTEMGGIVRSNLRFDYNFSDTVLQVKFIDSTFKDVYGTLYTNAANIPPHYSKILIFVSTNTRPIVNPISNITITQPFNSTPVTGSATDPGGSITGYQYSNLFRPAGAPLPTFSPSANQASVTINNLTTVGNYAFNFRATGSGGSGDTASVNFNVTVNAATPPPNTPPVFVPATIAPQTKTLPVNTTTATAFATDDVGVLSYRWYVVSSPGSMTISNVNVATPTFGWTNAGTYNLRVVAKDASDSTSTTWQLTVLPQPTTPPIPNAGNDTTMYLPDSETQLFGSGEDGTACPITSNTWELVSNPAGSSPVIVSPGNYVTTIHNMIVAGDYVYRLKLTSGCSAPVYDYVTVKVLPADIPVVGGCNCFPIGTYFENQ